MRRVVIGAALTLTVGCHDASPRPAESAPAEPATEVPLLLTSVAGWSEQPGVSFANYGTSVAGGGDLNGDGLADVVVGAPGQGTTYDDEGAVFVYLGQAEKEPDFHVTLDPTDLAAANFGTSVAMLGDVDGDGFGDMAVGSPNSGGIGSGTQSGAVYVYRGSSAGIVAGASPQVLRPVTLSGAHCGFSVAAAGDVNGDGLADLAVGCPDAAGTDGNSNAFNEGIAFVYLGTSAGLEDTPSIEWQPVDQEDARFGAAVAAAGDVDGDGLGDVVVGAPGATNVSGTVEGRAYVFTGAGEVWSNDPTDHQGAEFGAAVSGAGDVNGDGYADVIVGAPQYLDGKGAAYLYLGSASGLGAASEPLRPTTWSTPEVGFSVAGAGDLNGDGYADVVVGSPTSLSGMGGSEYGAVHVYRGSADGLAPSPLALLGAQTGQDFGAAVAGAGDVDGDGLADLLVGSPSFDGNNNNEGLAELFSGDVTLGNPQQVTLFDGLNDQARLGKVVSRVGDLDGDGFDDIALGAPNQPGAQSQQGAVYVVKGRADVAELVIEDGDVLAPANQLNAFFGVAIAGGDLDGDGKNELVIGASGMSGSVVGEGVVYVYYGNGTTNSVVLEGDEKLGGLFGDELAVVDLDRDGYAEVLVGAPASDFAGSPGRVYVFAGSAAGVVTTPAYVLEPLTTNGSGFGSAISAEGDLNGDGFVDVVIGAPTSGAVAEEGMILVYYGSAAGLSMVPEQIDPTDAANAHFGAAVAIVGDVNDDGFDDLAVGAPQNDSTGTVTIFFGNPMGISGTNTAEVVGAGLGSGSDFGATIAGVGEVDGRGRAFYLVGVPGDSAYLWVRTEANPLGGIGVSSMNAEIGNGLAGFGDVNGDGFADYGVGREAGSGEARINFGGDGAVGLDRRLAQLDFDGSRSMRRGNRALSHTVLFRGRVTQEDPVGGLLALEVELKPANSRFDGTELFVSEPVTSGTVAEITVANLEDIPYKWRARVRYPVGRGHSRWLDYGVGLPGADFMGNSADAPVPGDPDGGIDPGNGNGQSSLYGCGVAGPAQPVRWWMTMALGLLLVLRRRRRSPGAPVARPAHRG